MFFTDFTSRISLLTLNDMKFNTKSSVEAHAQLLIGKTIRELHSQATGLSKKHKGGFGHLLEEVHFGYEINSRSEADFKELGVELKGAPLRQLKSNAYRAKERIVLSIIDYLALVHQKFHTSDFWRKSEHLLLVFYVHEKSRLPADRRIMFAGLWSYSESDEAIIMQDWTFIRDKVKAGLAHELSEGDTNYLGACTKGANKSSLREQPFSPEPAMQRAFCLKTTYVNRIVEAFQRRSPDAEELFNEAEVRALQKRSFDEVVMDKFKPFQGKTVAEIAADLNVELNPKSKSAWAALTADMLGVKSIKTTPELEKANITVKTIRLKSNGVPKESISFPAFHFTELVEEDWEESELFEQLDSRRYLFVVYDLGDGSWSQMRLKKAVFWNMPQSDIQKARATWESTRATLRSGKIVKRIDANGTRRDWFPNMSETDVIHVRPHGQNREDTRPLPVADQLTGLSDFTKQCFWLNATYIGEVLKSKGV